jgi:hypothetical protein
MIGRAWPFRRIDYAFIRCGEHEGPTLELAACQRIFDEPSASWLATTSGS